MLVHASLGFDEIDGLEQGRGFGMKRRRRKGSRPWHPIAKPPTAPLPILRPPPPPMTTWAAIIAAQRPPIVTLPIMTAMPVPVEEEAEESPKTPEEMIQKAEQYEAQARVIQSNWGKRSIHRGAQRLRDKARALREAAAQASSGEGTAGFYLGAVEEGELF